MEFSEVVRQYNRMCDKSIDCSDCAFVGECDEDMWRVKPQYFEEKIKEWVKKNPEPLYPTVLEIVRHIATYLPAREDGKGWLRDIPLSDIMRERIPEEIAKEFGIVPINECGLSKYCEEEEEESEWR